MVRDLGVGRVIEEMEKKGTTMEVDATASGQPAATRDTSQDHSLSIHQPSEVWFSSLYPPHHLDIKSSSCIPSSQQYWSASYQIDLLQVDGEFLGADGTMMEGRGIVMAHLNECHELVKMVFSSSQLPPCSRT